MKPILNNGAESIILKTSYVQLRRHWYIITLEDAASAEMALFEEI